MTPALQRQQALVAVNTFAGSPAGEEQDPRNAGSPQAGVAPPSDARRPSSPCKPDSTGADWFACARGTIGCPRIHDGLTPHCLACAHGTCRYHDPAVLEERR